MIPFIFKFRIGKSTEAESKLDYFYNINEVLLIWDFIPASDFIYN